MAVLNPIVLLLKYYRTEACYRLYKNLIFYFIDSARLLQINKNTHCNKSINKTLRNNFIIIVLKLKEVHCHRLQNTRKVLRPY